MFVFACYRRCASIREAVHCVEKFHIEFKKMNGESRI
jgi:hypothetical protein